MRAGAAPPPAPGTVRKWWLGARPRTLPAALVPVVVGTAAAHPLHHVAVVVLGAFGLHPGAAVAVGGPVAPGVTITTAPAGGAAYGSTVVAHFHLGSPAGFWWRALGALVVALAVQVGTNYANDYSDGIRGTDDARVGPVRLTASGLASAAAVKRAALIAFGVAAVVGLGLAWATSWWILLVGAACLLAGWFYTGGPRPYGYAGLGELFVFVFFGLVATVGTFYVETLQLGRWQVWTAAIMVGLLATALLLANNLRDIATDIESGKRTLAVRIGRPRGGLVLRGVCRPTLRRGGGLGAPRGHRLGRRRLAGPAVPATPGHAPGRAAGTARRQRRGGSGTPAGARRDGKAAVGIRGDIGPRAVAHPSAPGGAPDVAVGVSG